MEWLVFSTIKQKFHTKENKLVEIFVTMSLPYGPNGIQSAIWK